MKILRVSGFFLAVTGYLVGERDMQPLNLKVTGTDWADWVTYVGINHLSTAGGSYGANLLLMAPMFVVDQAQQDMFITDRGSDGLRARYNRNVNVAVGGATCANVGSEVFYAYQPGRHFDYADTAIILTMGAMFWAINRSWKKSPPSVPGPSLS